MSSDFKAIIDLQEIRWQSIEPHLSGSPNLAIAVQREILSNDLVMITPTGPSIASKLSSPEAVAAVILKLYPTAEIIDGPDLTLLYADDDAPTDAIY